ncbi:ABC1 kinase family protein [Leptotrichia sp. oral taxon 847]|uniref:ABC1 kinase family protein n=1 Tax=Leptotrichia sp. oral taxon 847 TaxID=1785996 RepID=UPI0007682937|nr:AarF/UbiB family protein [Leptotrichia sp. oral taxon 847]AMD95222.1 ABC transporter [Leptotrichia sp. oral taxon 847]
MIQKFKRMARLSEILFKYGFEELFDRSGIEKFIPNKIKQKSKKIENIKATSFPERIRMAMEELGPTYVKLGQMCSNRTDIFPPELIAEFQKLQDNVEPEKINIYEKIKNELNIEPFKYFKKIEEIPIASASMGQVFRGILKNGNEIVLKVRRENIKEIVAADLLVMKDFASNLEKVNEEIKKINLSYIINTFANSITKELSFRNELNNMERFANNFKNDERIHTPKTYKELSNDNILCMEFIDGFKITDIKKIKKCGFLPEEVAKVGLDLYIKQVLKYGFFHADPHPGNILMTENGKIVFIDFGAMGSLYPQDKELLESLLMYFIQKNIKKAIETIRELSVMYNVPDEKNFERELTEIVYMVDGNSLNEISLKDIFEKTRIILSKNQITLPEDIYLLAKGIGQIEGIGRHLDPSLNISKIMKPYANEISKKRLNPRYIFEKGSQKFAQVSESWLSLPEDLKSISQKLLNGELKHKHEVMGFKELQKTLDRLVTAIIIAALLIASSILVLSNIPPKINGIPALGFLGYAISAILGIIEIVKKNKKF